MIQYPAFPPSSSRRGNGLPFNGLAAALAVLCFLAGAALQVLTRQIGFLIGGIIVGAFILLSLKMCNSWQRALVLRAGKIQGLRGPGLFLIIPFVDQVSEVVDQRIRTVPVHTRQTLTRDTTPVDVDAVVFWMVHDPLRAITELDDYEGSVSMVALTTLREVVSSSDLAVLLEDRRRIDDELRDLIEVKTREWGVTVQAVEIRDVQLPDNLQDAMSRQAQAERERAARVTLASAERQVAVELAAAAKTYEASPIALQILQINRVFEMNKNRGTTILMPTTMADAMGNATAFAAAVQAATQAGSDSTAE
ncbi:SPFH domain-containing protein [Gluconobacter thailandicus]|uniref:Slipin family protein n=1 Tax=Gluconobacter thailandicus TaxID=257438 RepID=A0AAP9ER66_GLUTH|nr:slipin family protein [Gluconobacter thailandicus]KXV34158.1 membrane protease subunit, stomatin/prohibitin [Gluconobacter thailandicus]QEH95770.1 slipin family protein [Gluconobacter thailandicus]